jgi:putative flippase GtrA
VIGRLSRYTVVSAACMVLQLSMIVGISAIGVHYIIATAVAFAIVCVVGYQLHARWTYDVPIQRHGFARYIVAMMLNLPLSILLIWIGHSLLRFPIATAALFSTGVLVMWNFVAARWALVLPNSARGRQP